MVEAVWENGKLNGPEIFAHYLPEVDGVSTFRLVRYNEDGLSTGGLLVLSTCGRLTVKRDRNTHSSELRGLIFRSIKRFDGLDEDTGSELRGIADRICSGDYIDHGLRLRDNERSLVSERYRFEIDSN